MAIKIMVSTAMNGKLKAAVFTGGSVPFLKISAMPHPRDFAKQDRGIV